MVKIKIKMKKSYIISIIVEIIALMVFIYQLVKLQEVNLIIIIVEPFQLRF